MKYVLVVVVVLIAVLLLRSGSRRGSGAASPPPPAPPPPSGRKALSMVACAHCGLHLPGADALRDGGGRAYCTDDHLRAGPR